MERKNDEEILERRFKDYRNKVTNYFFEFPFERDPLFKYMYEVIDEFTFYKYKGKIRDLTIDIKDGNENRIEIGGREAHATHNKNLSIIPMSRAFNGKDIKYVATEVTDKLEVLTTALENVGFLVKVKEGSDEELRINYDLGDLTPILNKTVIVIEKGAKLKLIKRDNGSSKDRTYRYENYDIYIKSGASLEIDEIGRYEGFFVTNSNFNITCDGNVKIRRIKPLDKFSRYRTNVKLGRDAKADIKIGEIAPKDEFSDLFVNVVHEGRNSSSEIEISGVFANDSRAYIKGLVKIGNQASESKTNLSEKVLELGNSKAKLIPALEIENSNVDASHTDFKGPLDDEKLNYLKSRGLSEKEAKRELIFSFLPKYEGTMQEFLEDTIETLDL